MRKMDTLGDRIRAARLALGLRQNALADKLGWSNRELSAVEKSDRSVRADRLRQLAKALGVSADYLLGLDASKPTRRAPRKSPGKP